MISEKPKITEEEENTLANTLEQLQTNGENKDQNLERIIESDTKEESRDTNSDNDETLINQTYVEKIIDNSEVASNSSNYGEVKMTGGHQKCSTLPREDPSLKDDHTEILNKTNTLRSLSKVMQKRFLYIFFIIL